MYELPANFVSALRSWDFMQALTVAAACVAAYIACQQWLTNKRKLKLDLFDRRFKVYLAARSLLREIRDTAEVRDETKRAFVHDIEESEFLFEREATDFLSDLLKRALALRSDGCKLDRLSGAATNDEKADGVTEHMRRIGDWAEAEESKVAERFQPYLDFRKLK